MPSATPKKSEKATSASASASAGAGGAGAGAGKRKRPRKSKKRTTEVVSDSSDDDESSDEEDETAPAQQVKRVAPKKQIDSGSDSDTDSDSSSSSSSDSESEEEVKESRGSKRKRKRKRASDKDQVKKVEEPDTVAKQAEPRSEGASTEQIQQLGEPEEDGALGEPAKRALEYARQYHLDRPAWKFNKARQLWLIRHALSIPTSEGLSVNPSEDVANKEAVSKENKDSAKEDEEEEEEILPFWTDRWTVLAGSYLATVQGGAKEVSPSTGRWSYWTSQLTPILLSASSVRSVRLRRPRSLPFLNELQQKMQTLPRRQRPTKRAKACPLET